MKQEISFEELLTEDFNEKLNKLFPLKAIQLGKIVFGGDIMICFVKFPENDDLAANWKEFNSYLTTSYIVSLPNEFSRWNFYILYISEAVVVKQLKYEIENNKFSTRKIVIENFSSDLSGDHMSELIQEHITNSNITSSNNIQSNGVLVKDPRIEQAIKKFSKQNSKKNNEDLQDILQEIENSLGNEI